MTKKAQTRDSGENSSAAEKKVHRLETAVEDSVGDFERLTSEISDRIENKEEALRKELDETNAALAEIKQDMDKGAVELRNRVWSSVGWARQRVARLEVLCYVVAFVFVLVYFGVLRGHQSGLELRQLAGQACHYRHKGIQSRTQGNV
jgi:hypothetical protein